MNEAEIAMGLWEKVTTLIESGEIENQDLLKILKEDQRKFEQLYLDMTEQDTHLLQEIGFT